MSQRFRSQYGRPSIQVPDSCPTSAITSKLGRVHVGTPFDEVERTIREAAAARQAKGDTGWTPKAVEDAVRFALWRHAENRAEYGWVMGGMHS